MDLDLSSQIARRVLLSALRDYDLYRTNLAALDKGALSREDLALKRVAESINAFHEGIGDGLDRALRYPGYVLSVLGGLSLFGSVVDGPLQAMLAIFGFVSTVGGAMLLLLDGHLASERDRSRRWVLAAQRALNERGALLHTEIWERIGRR